MYVKVTPVCGEHNACLYASLLPVICIICMCICHSCILCFDVKNVLCCNACIFLCIVSPSHHSCVVLHLYVNCVV